MARTFTVPIITFTKGESGGAILTGQSYATVAGASVPFSGYFEDVSFTVVTSGVSGTYSAKVVCALAGSTDVYAGITGLAANVGVLIGATSTPLTVCGVPKYVQFESGEDACGFTSTIYMTGKYGGY